jgi:hypothetical protein
MTDRIELHEDDVETVARHMWEVEKAEWGVQMPVPSFDDMAAYAKSEWSRWARAACDGASVHDYGICLAAWTAARGMTRAMSEQRARLVGEAKVLRDAVEVLCNDLQHERRERQRLGTELGEALGALAATDSQEKSR